MVDVATLGFESDTSGLTKAEKALDGVEKQSKQTEKATDQLARSFDGAVGYSGKLAKAQHTAAASQGRMRGAVQNTAFQLQDMAVQFEMGTDASRVFAQQLPQLLGGFGALGAVLGVVAGVGIPLVAMFLDSGDAASEAKDNIEDYEDAMQGLKSISKDLAVEQAKLAGTFRGMRIFDAEQQLRDLQTVYQELAKSGEGGAGLFTVLFGGKTERQEIFDQIRQINIALVDARKEQAELDNIEAFENLKEDARDLFESLSPLTKITREYRDNVALLEKAEREGALSTSKKVAAMGLLTQQYNDQIDPLQNTLSALREERELIMLSNDEREIEAKLRKTIDDLRRSGQVIKQSDITALRQELELNQRLSNLKQQMKQEEMMEQSAGGVFGNVAGDLGQPTGPFAEVMQRENELIALQEHEARKLEITRKAIDARLITEEEGAARIAEIQMAVQEKRDAIMQAQNMALLSGTASTFDQMATAARGFAGEQSGIYRAMFAVSKAFAIADSIIKIQQGIANAASLPWPTNFAAMASVAAAGASIISNIQAVTGQGFADGGFVTGPGGPRSDSIPARLSNGEFVMNAQATRQNRPMLEAMNSGTTMKGGGVNVSIQNYAGVDMEVQQLSETDVVIIARRTAKQVVREDAPQVISADLTNPNSRTSRAIGQNTNAQRKR